MRSSGPGRIRERGAQFLIPEAIRRMVIDHADGLHKRIADRRSHERKTSFLEIFAHGFSFRCLRRDLFEFSPGILDCSIAHKPPDI